MPAQSVQAPSVTADNNRASFFRQSGWLMIATVGGGVFMTLMHFLSRAIPKGEYSQFGVFLAVTMFIPALPLQMVLAQQTARSLALHREHELSGLIRTAWIGTFLLWLIAAIGVLLFQGTILSHWKITNPAALYLTLPAVLGTIWLPMFYGVLQGQQNFLWMGWSMMLHGMGRVGCAAIAVILLHWSAPGMVVGMLGGFTIALAIAIWPTRSLWLQPAQSFEWRPLLRQIIPLVLGFGAYQFMLTADTMFVKAYFTESECANYISAGTLSRASMWLVGPLAAVMFPKIVHARAKSQESDLLGIVLIGTLVLAAGGAMGLWVLAPFVVGIVFPPEYVKPTAVLLPWYAWAVVPLALASALLNNLLARMAFKVIPALCVLAVLYGFGLTHFHDSLLSVIKTLGCCNLVLLAVCGWYTWRSKETTV